MAVNLGAVLGAVFFLVKGPVISSVVKFKAAESIYKISIVETSTGKSLGSGTAWITKTGAGRTVAVTNAHVCGQLPDGTALDGSEERTRLFLSDSRETKVIKVNPVLDICIMSVQPTNKKDRPIEIGGAPLQPGDDSYVIGHPRGGKALAVVGQYLNDTHLMMPVGNAEIVKRAVPDAKCLPSSGLMDFLYGPGQCIVARTSDRHVIRISPGNSGSPVLNSSGQAVGMVWGFDPNEQVGLTVQLEEIRKELGYLP